MEFDGCGTTTMLYTHVISLQIQSSPECILAPDTPTDMTPPLTQVRDWPRFAFFFPLVWTKKIDSVQLSWTMVECSSTEMRSFGVIVYQQGFLLLDIFYSLVETNTPEDWGLVVIMNVVVVFIGDSCRFLMQSAMDSYFFLCHLLS